MLNEVLAISGR